MILFTFTVQTVSAASLPCRLEIDLWVADQENFLSVCRVNLEKVFFPNLLQEHNNNIQKENVEDPKSKESRHNENGIKNGMKNEECEEYLRPVAEKYPWRKNSERPVAEECERPVAEKR